MPRSPGSAKPSLGGLSPATSAFNERRGDATSTLLVIDEDTFDDLIANDRESQRDAGHR